MSKIAIIGPYPPPFGGVSIHIKRLSELFKENNINYEIIDDSNICNSGIENYKNKNYKKLILDLIFNKKEYDILHFNSRNWKFIFFICFMNKIKSYKIILTLHSFREDVKKRNIKSILIMYVLKRVNSIIAVSEEIKEKLLDLEIDENKIIVLPAFIPPILEPEKIKNIKKKYFDVSKYTIIANASKIEFYNNEDLYGLDMCINMANILKRDNYEFQFIFILSEINDVDYYEKNISLIKQNNLEDIFKIVISKEEFSYFLDSADMFIRPTNTDGDSVSIRESLYLGKTTIASDVVNRPLGVYTFENRNIDSLIDVVKEQILHKNYNLRVNNNEYKRILEVFSQYF